MAAHKGGYQAGPVAEVYAEALLPLGQQADRLDVLADELQQIAALLAEQPDFAVAFASPVIPAKRKMGLIERAFRGRVNDLTCDALGVIARHGRMGMIAPIAERFRKCVQDARRQVEVTVTTAAPLDPETRGMVIQRLTEVFGAAPVVTQCIDAELLGGLLIQTGDEMIDLSVRTELEQIKHTLARRLGVMAANEQEDMPGL